MRPSLPIVSRYHGFMVPIIVRSWNGLFHTMNVVCVLDL